MRFFNMQISALDKLTSHGLRITLKPPRYPEFHYEPGQFVIIETKIKGEVYQRAYSLSSSPITDRALQLMVKRIPGGVVSNHLHKHMKVGEYLRISEPCGLFGQPLKRDPDKIFCYAAGSGITPLWSLIKTVLVNQPCCEVYLLYGNRREQDIIFQHEIALYERTYRERFKVKHTLSQPDSKSWFQIFSTQPPWQGARGRITHQAISNWITPDAAASEHFICGPDGMINTTERALHSAGVSGDKIHIERFGSTWSSAGSDQPVSLIIETADQKQTLTARGNQTLLDALSQHGISIPHSCRSGSCGACIAQVTEGVVTMNHHDALSKAEIDAGLVLTCQARAQSPSISLRVARQASSEQKGTQDMPKQKSFKPN
ncbi:ferredoxin--NADP reductase [Neptunomonas marina]|uniref:Ferredoxin--NADP reductase n=1 Tax=Neptunomonas marina TaxID=1815562 RepID=A0A437QCV7_9GAMM|nr:ferredoxin--NADP reductase [Neptunomonas marina]RVU32364.1 ferredoxin--NADP reductase [Neptunomonas marina]